MKQNYQSLESLQNSNPAAFEAWRDLSVLLKEVRTRAGLTVDQLAHKTEISHPRISGFESCTIRIRYEELRMYYGIAVSVSISPVDIFETLCKAIDEENGYNVELSPYISGFEASCDEYDNTDEIDIIERAATDPKALLMSARWLPERAEDRMERIAYFNDYIGKVDGVKEYCVGLAKEAQQMLGRYKEIGKLFDTYAADLPGYDFVKGQFYHGQTLHEILKAGSYTRRWVQTLQARTLSTFQQRVKEQYDKRGIGT